MSALQRQASAALFAACGTALAISNIPSALADAPTDSESLHTIIVIGKRASLSAAQEAKREKLEIVDSIIAEDINKLPDFNVTDALQRVTGIQVARDRGEGTNSAIRGLTQMETTLNGREVFTAGSGRNLEFADIPAEMLAGIDVYKTSSADQIEGGVGGSVDLRTRRPFDFGGAQAAASIRDVRGDLVGKAKTQYSMLLSNRWTSVGTGDFGALLSIASQERSFREDQKSAGSPVVRTIDGQADIAPNGTTETTSVGTRKRDGGNLALQWRPEKHLDVYAEANYSELRTIQDQYQFTASAPTAASSASLVPGTRDIQAVTWSNAPITTVGATRDTIDRTSQMALGGSWRGDNLTVRTDLSYTKSHNYLLYSALTLNGTAASLSQDLAGNIPVSTVAGSNLASLATFSSVGMWYASRPFDGDLKTIRLDGEYRLAGNVVDTLSVGLRYARRHATDAPGQVTFFPATGATSNAGSLAIANPISDFLPGSTSIHGYLVGNPDLARNPDWLRQALGITATMPTGNPLGTWDIAEETQSVYFMATLRSAALPLDGNLGIRLVQTHEAVSGYQTVAGGGTAAIAGDSRYLDSLPSLNLRYELAPGLYLRAAASKSLTRPDFIQMSPSLTLNPVQLIGTAGSPTLKPVHANNADLAAEWYLARSTSVHLTAFSKNVDGFVITTSAPEVIDGTTYQVSRPRNANTANVKGMEIGYQQFYDFLPGWLSGFGLQANYTYVDSQTLDTTLAAKVPLQSLSKNSGNIVAMYERDNISARLAYNWRDKFLTSVGNYAGVGPVSTYTRPYGWLDASFGYRVSEQLSLALEGLNLTRTIRRSYYGVETRPRDTWINDRQIAVTATVRF